MIVLQLAAVWAIWVFPTLVVPPLVVFPIGISVLLVVARYNELFNHENNN